MKGKDDSPTTETAARMTRNNVTFIVTYRNEQYHIDLYSNKLPLW